MKECLFCSLINKDDKELSEKQENFILYEDNLILIKPALGMSIPNYLMIISKQHINGFAELNEKELLKVEKILNTICNAYYKKLGVYPIIFEHGSLPNGRHPLSITHAHLHVIPINLSKKNLQKLFSELKLRKAKNINDLHKNVLKDYWMYRTPDNIYYMSNSIVDAPRSCFIKIVAQEAGFNFSYEWRNPINNREEDVKRTIDTFKNLFPNHNSID